MFGKRLASLAVAAGLAVSLAGCYEPVAYTGGYYGGVAPVYSGAYYSGVAVGGPYYNRPYYSGYYHRPYYGGYYHRPYYGGGYHHRGVYGYRGGYYRGGGYRYHGGAYRGAYRGGDWRR